MMKNNTGKKKQVDAIQIVSIVVTVCFILAGVVLLWFTSENEKQSKVKVAALKKQQVELEKQLNVFDNQIPQTKEEVTVSLKSCANIGREVVMCQDFYGTSDADASSDESRAKIRENAEKLRSYFTDDCATDAGKSWCVIPDAKWKFNTTYSFTDTKVPVLWTYVSDVEENKLEDLYAYVTGEYDTESKLFSKFNLHVTKLGQSKQPHD